MERIGVLGWSQGGWVGPLAASKSNKIAFVVSISGPGVSPLEQNIYDKTNRFAAAGATPKQVDAFERTIRLVWTYLVTGENRAAAEAAWASVAEADWFQDRYNGPPMMDRDLLLQDSRMAHYVAHSSYDPVPVLASLDVPMLAVFGEADTVVPVETSIEAMQRAFDGGAGVLTIKTVPDADHGLRVNGRRMADSVPPAVIQWVRLALGEP